eukprot:204559-Pleurochrysis_carterae.AAC.1
MPTTFRKGCPERSTQHDYGFPTRHRCKARRRTQKSSRPRPVHPALPRFQKTCICYGPPLAAPVASLASLSISGLSAGSDFTVCTSKSRHAGAFAALELNARV